jgi:replicative DNA helicase
MSSAPNRRQNEPPPANVVQGMAPPHSLDAETALLGAILLSERPMYTYVVTDNLRPDDFYRPRHQLVFGAMLSLFDAGEPIDILTVVEHMRQSGTLEEAGGQGAVDGLTAAPPDIANLRRYGQIVKELALLRKLLDASYEIQASVHGHEGEPRELVERAERLVLEVARDDTKKDFRAIEEVLHQQIDILHQLSVDGAALTGTPTGFDDLDAITGGFQPGALVVLAARPGMGKSCLVTNMAENAAIKDRRPVLLFSLEMSEAELAQRFIASQARIKGDDLRKGRVKEDKWPRVLSAANELAESPLYLDDSSDVSVLDIRAKCRRMYSKHGKLGMVIVDYLQLMRSDGKIENRAEQISQMSRGLKILAQELDVPVVALSQLNRGVESRTDKRPMLSDLRESGAIEQDADLVLFIYRDEYYNKDDTEFPGEAELLIAKNRSGALRDVRLTFQAEYPKFLNYAGERYA